MKIAIFTDCYLDLTGGIVTAITAEKSELERRGHIVYVFSSSYPKSAAEKAVLARDHIYPVPSCRLFGRGATPIARRPRVIEKWLMKRHSEIREFDLFYVHYEAGCSIAGLRLGKRLGKPTVQVMHGREDVGEVGIIPRGFRTLVAAALDLFHSWYLPHPVKIRRDTYLAQTRAAAHMWSIMVNHANAADLVITPSAHFRDKLKHYGVIRPIKSLHHGVADALVDAKVSPTSLAPGAPLEIIWHSRLSGEKRILPFLEALSLMPRETYHVNIFGEGPEAPVARTYARLHRLNVTFRGVASIDKITETLHSSNLDVLVSYNYDTFGMTLIEAEACGVPVLIADPDLTEIVPRGSFILTASPAPADIAGAIKDILAHPERVAKMSTVMLKNRENIRISGKIDRLERIFRELISKQPLAG